MPEPIAADEADVELFADREALRAALKPLGRQALVVLAVRAAKRVAVFVALRGAATEAAAAGLSGVDQEALYTFADTVSHYASAAAMESADGADEAAWAADFASTAPRFTDPAVWKAVSFDLHRLYKLHAQRAAPTGWDDPRLGPLWPDGLPEWHARAERELRDLQQRLANRPT